jgi:hypothetical protein
MKRKTVKKVSIIHSFDEIPKFSSEDEEREWWATHDLSEQLYDQLEESQAELEEILPLKEWLPKRKIAS